MNTNNLTQTKFIVLVSLFFVLFYNYTFFTNTLTVYPLEYKNSGFLLSLSVILTTFIILLLTLVSSKWTTKPIVIILFLISSLSSYFMNTYHIIIDANMITNIMQTNIDESMDLLTVKQFLYFFIFGILPAFWVYKSDINYRSFKSEIISKIKVIVIALIIIASCLFVFSKHYTSFFREHKSLRYATNPTYWIYSIGKYIDMTLHSGKVIVKPIGLDAKIVTKPDEPKKLVIMVVGEALRADHFSLNSYKRETNPKLSKKDIINFSNTYSCGTSTAVSVPCMFSIFGKDNYSYKKGISNENVLDILRHSQEVSILWRDNNSDSKGVALRVEYENYRTAEKNTICDKNECRDEGMLVGLDDYIAQQKNKNILIILHQMGNHGPSYYKRYPKDFEKFTPICKTNQLENCTQEEISNAYDNAILYTDYFLAKVIDFLKKYDSRYKSAMIYMSDHGESLGENGIYLHGLPYFMAPDAQIHVGFLMWFGNKMKEEIDTEKIEKNSSLKYTHNNLFHTLLGIFNVQVKVYEKEMDITTP